jgi:hypothetical protein
VSVRWASGAFAIVPEWLLDAQVKDKNGTKPISDRAIRLFAVLARHADKDGTGATPSKRKLAERLGCSQSTLYLATQELIEVGAVKVKARTRANGDKGQTSNEYILQPIPDPPCDQSAAPPDDGSDAKNESPNEPEESKAIALLSREPPKLTKPQADRIVDRLAEECGVDPRSPRMRGTGVAAAQIRKHVAGTLETPLPSEAFVELVCQQISGRAALYRERMNGARLTPSALKEWWFDVPNVQPRGSPKRFGRGMTARDILNTAEEDR